MSRKMLVLGALPRPFEGPWVPLGSGTWVLDDITDPCCGKVNLEVETSADSTQVITLDGALVKIVGERARIVILEEIEVETLNIGVTRIA